MIITMSLILVSALIHFLLLCRRINVNGRDRLGFVEGQVEHWYAILDALWECMVGGCGSK